MNLQNKISGQHTQLQTGLSQFGLRPKDWIIELGVNDLLLIRNKSEESFCFVGKVKTSKKPQKLDWQFITLASL